MYIMITKQEYEVAKAYKTSFKESRADFYRAMKMSAVKELNEIYEAHGLKMLSRNCSRCILQMLKWFDKEVTEFETTETEAVSEVIEAVISSEKTTEVQEVIEPKNASKTSRKTAKKTSKRNERDSKE